MTWERSGNVTSFNAGFALFEIHHNGERHIAWKYSVNAFTKQVIAVVDRYVATDINIAKNWCMAHYEIDQDPWEASFQGERLSAYEVLRHLHELEKQQDRYRIYN